jgi:hypothetical protein
MIGEHSRFRLLWDGLVLLLIIFSCILIPFQFAFQQTTALNGFQLIYLIDLVFLIDIGLNCRTSFRRHGSEVTDRPSCTREYLHGHFYADLIATFPLDLAVWILFGNGQIMGGSVVLLLRMMRLFRIVRLFVILRRWESFSWSNPGALRLIKFLALVMLLMHWLACGWFFTAFADGFPASSWAVTANIHQAGLADQYIRSLYWTITTMTTVGFGDITPNRSIEYLYTSLVMLLGASLYAFIIGGIASLLANLQAAKSQFRDRTETVTEFLRQRQVPAEINARVRNYYEYVWDRYRGLNESDLLKDLPEPVRLEIMLHLARNVIENVPLFRHSPPVIRNALLMALEARTYTPGSFIVREDEIGKAIYLITAGSVEIQSIAEEKSYGKLEDGDYFGYMSLVLGERRTASVIACEYCDLLVLSNEHFNRIKDEFPEFTEVLKKASAERMERMSELVMEGVVL